MVGITTGITSKILQKNRPLGALRIQSSINGTPIPIVSGQTRVAGCGIWTDGFDSQTHSAGKGSATGKGGTTTTYSANIAFGVCEGPAEFFTVWNNQSVQPLSGSGGLNFTAFAGTPGQTPWGFLTSKYPEAAIGYSYLAYAGANPFKLGSSPSMPNLTWEMRGAIANPVFEIYTIGSPYTFTPTYFNLSFAAIETANVPAVTPYEYQASNFNAQGSVPVVLGKLTNLAGTISQGVIDSNGNVFTRVSSGPAAGQYTVTSKGLYTFNSADAGKQLTIIDFAAVPGVQYAYQSSYTLTSGSQTVSGTLPSGAAVGQRVTGTGIPNGTFVQAASGGTITFTKPATVSGAQTLTFWGAQFKQVTGTPSAGQFNVSVQNGAYGKYTFAAADNGKKVVVVDIVDANAADDITDKLTNDHYGAGFPSENLDALTELRNYTGASGLFISSGLSSSQSASDYLTQLSTALNGEFVWSGSLLTWRSYGDVPLSGYGYTFTPNLTPIYVLTDDDFMANTGTVLVGSSAFGSVDPIVTALKSPKKLINELKLSFTDRGNAYNPGVALAQDDASIFFYGRQPSEPKQADFFCIEAAGALSAQLQLGRQQLRRQFGFTLPWYFALLDPMDIVAITEPQTGLSTLPVRAIEITENENDCSLSFVTEEVLQGNGTPGIFTKAANGGYIPDSNVTAPATNAPLFFAPPFETSNGQIQLGIALSGPTNWGGCDIYVSSDGSTYTYFDTISQAAPQGTLTATFGSGSDPDTADTLSVDLTESLGALASGSNSDADNGHTLCVVDSEFISYSNVTPTGTYTFDMDTYIRRGLYGSAIASHSAGAQFARLNTGVFYYPLTPNQLGTTLYFKFVSFNQYGSGKEDISTATAYSYTPTGPATAYGPSLLTITPTVKGNQLNWANPTNWGVAATQIWRSTNNTFASAIHIDDAAADATQYLDQNATSNTQYWYWIVSEDNAGNTGNFYPATASPGISSTSGRADTVDLVPNAATNTQTFSATNYASLSSHNLVEFTGGINNGTPIEVNFSGYIEGSRASGALDGYLIARVFRTTDSTYGSYLSNRQIMWGINPTAVQGTDWYAANFLSSADSWAATSGSGTTNQSYWQLTRSSDSLISIHRSNPISGLLPSTMHFYLRMSASATQYSAGLAMRVTVTDNFSNSTVIFQDWLSRSIDGTFQEYEVDQSYFGALSNIIDIKIEFSNDVNFTSTTVSGTATLQIEELIFGEKNSSTTTIQLTERVIGKTSGSTVLPLHFSPVIIDDAPPTSGAGAYLGYVVWIDYIQAQAIYHPKSSYQGAFTLTMYTDVCLVANQIKR